MKNSSATLGPFAKATIIGACTLFASATEGRLANAMTSWSPESTLAAQIPGAARMTSSVSPSGRAVLVWDERIGIDFPVTFNGIYAAVRPSATGAWNAASKIADVGAQNAGSVVDPVSGKVTVFWVRNGLSFASASSDGGLSWLTQQVPATAGYSILAGVGSPAGPFVDIDSSGTITIILVKVRVSPANVFDVQALTRSSSGKWSKAITTGAEGASFYGRSKLNVLSDRSAFLNIGFTTFRRSTGGKWSRQTANVSALGGMDSASADIDRTGKGYFVVNSALNGAMLSTSTATSGWTAFQPVAALNTMFDLRVAGASGGKVAVTGTMKGSANVGISVTSDGGGSWSAAESFGFGRVSKLEGSENGAFAANWVTYNGATYVHSALSGRGPGAWQLDTFGGNLPGVADEDYGTIAIVGTSGSATARVVTGWPQLDSPLNTRSVGARSGTVSP